jgi:hypothetical protein
MPQSHPRAALRAARLFLAAVLTAAVVAVAVVVPVLAHGELVFQLGAERIQPGGSVEIRGDVGVGSSVEIVLIGKTDGSRRSLGTLADFEDGHFQGYVTIPADVAVGEYLLEAGTESIAVRAPLVVAGAAVVEGGDRPGQEEPLVAPMPSGLGGVAVATLQPGAPLGPAVGGGSRDFWPISPVLVAAILVIGAVALLVGLRLAGRPRSGTG